MTSENSLWTNLKINNKRRLWVWVLSLCSMLTLYAGTLTVYFVRYATWRKNGDFRILSVYQTALRSAVLECLTSYRMAIAVIILAVIVATQGYSYLFSRKKVDMYHSVPVSLKKRFFTIYLNGIFIFLASLLAAYALCFIMVGARGIMTIRIFAKMSYAMLVTFMTFWGAYNLTVLAVMLTGNIFMSTIMAGIVIFYFDIWRYIISSYRGFFYQTLITYYDKTSGGFSIYTIFIRTSKTIGNLYSSVVENLRLVGIATLKDLVWIILALIWAYSAYKKRPAEAAGNSMAFYSTRMIIKLLISVPAGLLAGSWMYSMGVENLTMLFVSLILGTILAGLVTEIAFNYEFKSAFKHIGIIFVALIIVIGYYSVHKWDVFGFDRYIPEKDNVESFALLNSYEAYITDSINFDADPEDYETASIDPYAFARDNMYLTDSDAIISLAEKSQNIAEEDRSNCTELDVYYRLKSGRNVSRRIWVDLSDGANDGYLNRLIGPAYYKEGVWQAMTEDAPIKRVDDVSFTSSISTTELKKSEVNDIIALWRKDMENYDYNRVRFDREIGYVYILFDTYEGWTLPVYDCFDNIKAYLDEQENYSGTSIPNSCVEAVNITYYPVTESGEYLSPETYSFEDEETINMIMDACEAYPTHSGWIPSDIFASDYSVEILLKPEYIKEYGTYDIYSYNILSEKLPALKSAEILP